jgi:hypothetical protein
VRMDPNRYTARAKFCFCKNNKRTIIIAWRHSGMRGSHDARVCAPIGMQRELAPVLMCVSVMCLSPLPPYQRFVSPLNTVAGRAVSSLLSK